MDETVTGGGVQREVERDGIRWTCVQAYAGLGNEALAADAAQVDGGDRVRVVCTPTGGSRSVELELPPDWPDAYSDEDLLGAIESGAA